MSTIGWILWNELVKSDYKIKYIEMLITIENINIQIIFDNNSSLEYFSIKIFKQINYILNSDVNNNLLKFDLQMISNNNIVNLFENLNYPPNVNTIIIMIDTFCSKSFLLTCNNIKLFNLPEQLVQLQIISLIPFDLSNLPTKIFLLDISKSDCNFNLNYLPDSIKVLYLPELSIIIQNNYQYQYKLSDLSNLPSSLIEINIGNNKNIVYTSIENLIKNFNNDIN